MMNQITNLKDYKEKKRYEKIISDMFDILNVMDKSEKALSFFKYYQPVQEMILMFKIHREILEINKKKCQYELEKITKKHS